jgi:uncharacterized membrane protein
VSESINSEAFQITGNVVPLPPSYVLMLSGTVALALLVWRRRESVSQQAIA